MEVLHFPDDPRPPWLVHPVLALGNFDGLHRGHLKIVERVRRGAVEHGGTPMAMTFDPHPPRVVRPDKAPPLLMTQGAAARGARPARASAPSPSCASRRELSQWDPETFVRTVLVDWLRVSEVWVGANFLFGHERSGNFFAAADARAALRLSGREDRSGPLQGVRRQQHAHPPPGGGRAHGRGRRAARPPLLRWRARSSKGSRRGREIGFPTANLGPTTS